MWNLSPVKFVEILGPKGYWHHGFQGFLLLNFGGLLGILLGLLWIALMIFRCFTVSHGRGWMCLKNGWALWGFLDQKCLISVVKLQFLRVPKNTYDLNGHDHSFFYLSLFESSILVDSWIVWPSSMIIYQHHMLTQCFLESWKKSMRKISSLFDFLQSRRCTWDNSRKLTIWKNPSIVDGIYQERWGFSMARLVDRRVYPSIVFNSSRAFFGGLKLALAIYSTGRSWCFLLKMDTY